MKTSDVLSKLSAVINPVSEIINIFGYTMPTPVPLALAAVRALIQHFSKFDKDKDWTIEEIVAEGQAAIIDIQRRQDLIQDKEEPAPEEWVDEEDDDVDDELPTEDE